MRSSFDYEVHDNNVVSIEDRDEGGMTVTNNIEAIIEDISTRESLDPSHYVWIYRDSNGIWDGFDPSLGTFYSIGEDDLEAALSSSKLSARARL